MIPVFSQKDAFALDELTVSSKLLTENELMDNAGRSIAQFIVETIEDPFNQKFIVLAGPGNNGGDAIISHYYLTFYGVKSEILLLEEKQKKSWIFNQYSIDADSIEIYSDECSFNPEYWYVDGIFGIGLKRTVKGRYKDIIDKLSECPHMIAIDIPSGIYCDTGTIAGTNIQAEYTLTMGHPKLAHFFNDGLEYSGDLHVLDIGFKQLSKTQDYIQLIEPEDAGNISPVHSENSHKYSRGKLISIAGASGYTGACILAVQAAGDSCRAGRHQAVHGHGGTGFDLSDLHLDIVFGQSPPYRLCSLGHFIVGDTARRSVYKQVIRRALPGCRQIADNRAVGG